MKTKHGIRVRQSLTFGIVAVLAAAMVLFAACGGSSGSSGPKVSVPSAGSLPALVGTAVTKNDTAWIEGVLTDLEDTFDNNFYSQLQAKVVAAQPITGSPYNFSGDINLVGIYGITSGTLTTIVHVEANDTSENSKVDTKAKTNLVTTSGLTVLTDSVWGQAYSESWAKAYSFKEVTAFGFTVTKGGISAKIVYSSTYTETDTSWTLKGKVTVYGANNEKVYEDDINESGH
jgi:hypothetical protein